MKKCEQIRDMMLTDYLDGELDKNAVEGIESHLLDCGDCRAFFKEVRNNTTLPFQKVLRQPVPAELWSAIKENIENENHATAPLADFFDKFRELIVFPKLVPVFASLVLMFLAGSVTLNTMQIQQAKDKEQGEYLVALLSPTGPSTQGDNNDLGTSIEHYFL